MNVTALPAAVLAILLAASAALAQPAGSEGNWKLVWADEFSLDGAPDPAKWGYESGFVRNNEAQWYQPENCYCEGGMLIIEARRERKPNPIYEVGSKDWRKGREFAEYTSASLTTRGKQDWTYGRFEMRGRIDTRAGLWPAFWTVGSQGHWPHCGEIDIMEYYRDTLLANVAWGAEKQWTARWHTVKHLLSSFNDPAWSAKFHVWRMDWTPESIKLYVDDQLLNTTLLKDTVNADAAHDNPFHHPQYIILNLAVGGSSGGDPSRTGFPARFEVDYVRVYQQEAPAGQ